MGLRKLVLQGAVVGAASLVLPAIALAEGTQLDGTAHAGEAGVYVQGGYAPPPGGEVQVVEQAPPQEQRAAGRGIQYGGHLLVSVPLHGVFAQDFGPGFGIHGRIGWELPSGWSVEMNLGFLYMTAQDPDAAVYVDEVAGIGTLYGGVGARYAFLNPSAIVPFLGVGLGLNYWVAGDSTAYQGDSGLVYCGSGVVCDAGDGTSYDTFGGVSLMGNASAGIIYELTSDVSVEIGAQYNLQWLPGPFAGASGERGGYLTIFGGGTLYY